MDEIELVRSRSKAANSGPWVTDWNGMAKKTVVRRLCKYLPMSPEIEKAMLLDVEAETTPMLDVPQIIEQAEEAQNTKTESVKAKIGAAKGEEK